MRLTVDGVDRSDLTRIPGLSLGASAFRGELGSGDFLVDDAAAALAFPALKVVRLIEDASGSDKHLFRGRVVNKGFSRGGFVADDARQFRITCNDSNWDLRRLRVHQWSRPAETGRARVVALGAYILNGASSTVTNANYRATTVIDVTTWVPNTNTQTMDARVYDSMDPFQVIDDCARAEGKTYFVFIDDDGDMFLWFDLPTSTSYASTLSITDDDPDLVTEFPPVDDGQPGEEDGMEILSGGALVPAGGVLSIVAESRPAIVTAHDVAEETMYDSGADSDAATRLGFFLDEREDEERRYACAVELPDTKAHLIKAGMTISFRWAAAGVTVPVILRVTRCVPEKIEPDLYLLHLEIGFPEKLFARIPNIGRGTITAGQVGTYCSSTCLDEFDRVVGDGFGRSSIFCRTWQSSEDGLHSADGDKAIQERVATNTMPTDWIEITEWSGANLEFLALCSIASAGGSRAFNIYQAADPLILLSSGPQTDGDANHPSFRWEFSFFGGTNLGLKVSASSNGVVVNVGSVDTGIAISDGTPFWLRCRLEFDSIRLRGWLDGSAEPGTWQAEGTGGGSPSFLTGTRSLDDCNIFAVRHLTSVQTTGTLSVDSLEFVGGVNCLGLTPMPSPIDSGNAAGGDLGGTYPNPTVDFVAFAKWSIE